MFLKKHFPYIRYLLKLLENKPLNETKIVNAKSGDPTIEVTTKNDNILIHSKYDPVKEAERFITQYEDALEKYEHVFFYGVGLGYHIQYLMDRYPKHSFTIYEPNIEMFYRYVSTKKIEELPLRNLKNIYIEQNEEDRSLLLEKVTSSLNENVLLIMLPSYERAFPSKCKSFMSEFKNKIKNNRFNLKTTLAFQRRWVLNSIKNFPKVIVSTNIFSESIQRKLKNKPIILASSGPSLNEELENLKKIKKERSAYIFSVGSANKTLIQHHIYPDAVFTYDPQGHNTNVFSDLINNNITEIPMVFGSSVGFETLDHFHGEKLHMITSQDSIAKYYLKGHITLSNIVMDAPSIAIITLQVLLKLGVSKVILVGQNFAYKNNAFYAKGIDYEIRNNSLSEQEKANAVEVVDVKGNKIFTNYSFLKMKQTMEQVIASMNEIDVINTTNGGARIDGTTYIPLNEVIATMLQDPIVDNDWYKNNPNEYPIEDIENKHNKMEQAHQQFIVVYKELNKIVGNMSDFLDKQNIQGLNNLLRKYDKRVNQLTQNIFYQVLVAPTVTLLLKITENKIGAVRFEKDTLRKVRTIRAAMLPFLQEVQESYQTILPAYQNLTKILHDMDIVN